MNRLPIAPFALLAALSAPAAAQNVNATVGPSPAPLGCPISITASNDFQGSGSSVACPFKVFDDQMNLVFDPGLFSACANQPILIGPWGWVTAHWDQRDNAGQPVPAGNYFVRVTYDVGPPTIHPLVLGGTDAGVVLEGTAVIQETLTGESRHFSLCAPLDAGFPYVLLASLTADVGIPTCAGTFPLDPDALFTLSLTAGAVFQLSLIHI